ncbi:FkbM family methyltransferase [Clostridium felsineum]|uniref:FkbM family methyltransferase n=1 Tax=Clostridium felsineum TaxID=36839 RepID=UPI00098C82E3|nr:FkbM family methyltransferase [Clostridium felsineum]URZ18164.1 hypothetical protein CLFE_042190 [Clostridium felsineum DSM 794]
MSNFKLSSINDYKIRGENSHSAYLLQKILFEVQKALYEEGHVNKYKESFKKESTDSWKFINKINDKVLKKAGCLIVNAPTVNKFEFSIHNKWRTIGNLYHIIDKREELDKIYNMLADKESKEFFDWLISYRISYALVGNLAKKIYPFSKEMVKLVDKKSNNKITKQGKDYKVKNFSIESKKHSMIETWVEEMYLLKGKCEPSENDVVISGGAFLGETAVWFADKVGNKGKVYSFEPSKDNCKVVQNNIDKNNLNSIISVVNKGLWNKTDKIYYTDMGNNSPGSFLNEDAGDYSVDVISIDDFVNDKKIDVVNFIKLDIEGGELKTLEGAINTITKFKPKLAISLYHNANDIIEIPLFVKKIVDDYKIYLVQNSSAWGDTILFASI